MQNRINLSQRILAVDDDVHIREIIIRNLLGAGYEVVTAKDGADAWNALNRRSYDLLITDHKMPRVTGVELIMKLRSIDMELPVILMSGTMPDEELKRHPWLRIDALLRMALVNLISNAVKFTRQRADAKIEIGCATSRDDETVIYIRDNGAGFDPDYTGKLFGAFQRLHTQDEFEGTGIGLANVKRIILRHGGRIWAKGSVDKGATFYFSLPRL